MLQNIHEQHLCVVGVLHTFMVLLCATPVGCHPPLQPFIRIFSHYIVRVVSLRFGVISYITDSARKTPPRARHCAHQTLHQ